jgi:hypothetical protein
VANKRDTSRQKRARQNRAQREALKARTQAASVPPTERSPKSAPSSPRAAAQPAKGGLFSGGGARAPRPGDRPVDVATLEGNWFSKRMQVPGGRQVLTGTLLTVVVTVLMALQRLPTADAPYYEASVRLLNEVGGLELTVTEANDFPDELALWEVLGPVAFAVLALPLLAMVLSAWATLAPYRRKVWIASSFVVAVVVMAGFIMYLFPVGFLTFAVWRAAKVEGPMRALKTPAPSAASEGGDDPV